MFPHNLFAADLDSDIPVIRTMEMNMHIRLIDEDWNYIIGQLADAVTRTVLSVPEEDRLRMELLHENKQLLVD